MELLIQNGADPNIGGTSGKTALIWAAEKGENLFYIHLGKLEEQLLFYTITKIVLNFHFLHLLIYR